jgi:Flp pilus assembly protein TadG
MLREFFKDKGGNYALMTVITMVPLMGALALGIDYTDLSRQRQDALNALDAAGIATARRIAEGADDAQAIAYANTFFLANLSHVDPKDASLTVLLPNNNTGGGTLKLTANMKFSPYFMPVASWLLGNGSGSSTINYSAVSEVRLKNTLEVALVLDNSGSMNDPGKNSSKIRFDLLKDAAKQLVTQLSGQAQQMKLIENPVLFSLVPFAASVNIGPGNADADWMDTTGISPIHHENFDWSTLSSSLNPNKYAQKVGDIWYARGTGWDATQKDRPLTRFSLYNLMQRVSAKSGNKYTYDKIASWGGCIEARPSPYNADDTPASTTTPATMFVPMFAPDETDRTSNSKPANNNWHVDVTANTDDAYRQRYMPKYFDPGTTVTRAFGMNEGPNASCSTTPITPLTDVSQQEGLDKITKAIDDMNASGATDVPEGMAWGWRTLSSTAPFTEGRPEIGKGNDKVLIVLTDGANTYYTPDTVQAHSYSGSGYSQGGNDLAGNKAIYSSLGYAAALNQSKPFGSPYTYGRMFLGTSNNVNKNTYTNANYTKAMNEQFATLCANAKTNNLIVMTIALDLDANKSADATQMNALKACASDSRFRKDSADPSKPAKLFWNSTGATLSDDFKEIGNELSNLRIVG